LPSGLSGEVVISSWPAADGPDPGGRARREGVAVPVRPRLLGEAVGFREPDDRRDQQAAPPGNHAFSRVSTARGAAHRPRGGDDVQYPPHPTERQDLLDHYRRSADPDVGHRAPHPAAARRRAPWATISAVLFCSLGTISRWKRRFEAEGVGAVFGRTAGGGPAPHLGRLGGPVGADALARHFRFARSRWSCEAAAVVLREDYRVKVGRETVRLWLRAAGLVWRRPRPTIRPKDPDREKKLAALRALLKGLPADETAVFMDEVDVNLTPRSGASGCSGANRRPSRRRGITRSGIWPGASTGGPGGSS